MTIDEAISKYRKLAKLARSEYESDCIFYGKETVDRAEKLDCLKRAEEYEQIVEWLEKLKIYRSGKFFDDIQTLAYRQGYYMAIDDFVNAIDERDREESFVESIWEIEEIAEKLKAGNKNES